MLRLIDLTCPSWLNLGNGVRVEVLPFTAALMLEIRAVYRREIADLGKDGVPVHPEDLGLRFTQCVARHAIIGWEGVGDHDGEPLDCTPEGVAALMGLYQYAKAFEVAYVGPRMALDAEKNGSSPAPNGTSAGARNTADGATAPVKSAPTH
jgi:hypothetical protein